MNNIVYIFFFLLNCWLSIHASAQFFVKIRWLDDTEGHYALDTIVAHYEQAVAYLQQYIAKWHNQGYLSADFDYLDLHDSTLYAFFYRGERFVLDSVIISETESEKQNIFRLNFSKYQHLSLSIELIDSILKYVYESFLQHGYPNANILVDSVLIEKQEITLILKAQKGKIATFDSIVNKGNLQVLPEILYALAAMKRGEPFSAKKIQHFEKKIQKISYLRQTDPLHIFFQDTLFQIILTLRRMRYNSFDGFVGILPRQQGSAVVLSGDVTFRAVNMLNLLEKIDLRWRSPAPGSQHLIVQGYLPVIPYTLFGIETQFRLQKIDTLFMNVSNNLFVFYPHSTHAFIPGITYRYIFSSSLTTHQTQHVSSLPLIADSRSVLYGIRMKSTTFDDPDNPRVGNDIEVDMSVGEKKLLNLQQFDTDVRQVQEKTVMFQGHFSLSKVIPLFSHASVYLRSSGIHLRNKFLLENELYRSGGLFSFRGFDEDFFSVSSYIQQTIEFRYLFERKSRFVIFFETAYMEKKLYVLKAYYRPFSFGSGLVLNTDAGLFSIYLAAGTFYGEPLYLRNTRVHFGYSLLF